MRLSFRIKQHFLNAFRELFVHHHGSLEFRSKILALIIATNDEIKDDYYDMVEKLGLEIYKNDTDRADLLVMTTKELVNKVKDDNGLDIDTLIHHIQQELRIVPRYAKKIDTDSLKPFIELTHDQDTTAYQENILEFLQALKEETLHTKKTQIAKDEENLSCKY